jgi:hypothetical protein
MKNRLIKLQNFFLTLGSLFRHPVEVPEIVMQYRNSEDLKKDIEDINRERIASLYQPVEAETPTPMTLAEELEAKKKEYRRINESFQKRLIFHVGFGGGLYSELDSMMEFMLFCYQNHIRFELYADDANFSKQGGAGWEELFEPFCPINHDPLNRKANYRPTDFLSQMRPHRLWVKGYYYPKKLKRNTGADYLTQDLWCMCISDEFKKARIQWSLFGMDGTNETEFAKLSSVAICPKPEIREKMDMLLAGLSLPEHYISIQVRGGDKYLEYDKLVEADVFIEKIERLGLDTKHIFVFTDDYRNVTYIKEKRPDWNIMTLTREDERGYYNSEFNRQDWEFRKANLIKLLAIIEVCVKADIHIGSNQSCVDMYLRSMKGDKNYIVL